MRAGYSIYMTRRQFINLNLADNIYSKKCTKLNLLQGQYFSPRLEVQVSFYTPE